MIVPSLTDVSARPFSTRPVLGHLVEARSPRASARRSSTPTCCSARVAPDIFVLNDASPTITRSAPASTPFLCPELVQSDIPLASEKGGVGIHLAEHAFALLLA